MAAGLIAHSPQIVAVLGPTAVGKSLLAEEIALHLGGEIVSADAMQVYAGMDVGTAKTPPLARRVPYHCVNLVEPGHHFSAALYQHEARAAIESILTGGALPVLVGGTGLYIRAALDGWEFPRGAPTSARRAELEAEAVELGAEALHARLVELDPASAALIHPANVRRTVRALEMAGEGASYAAQARGFSDRQSIYDTRFLGLTMDREQLYTRIDRRVDAMLDAGLVDEVSGLLDSGLREALTAAQAIGYKELVPVIEQGAALNEAVSSIKQASRRYAKRQMTWFRGDDRIMWIDVTERRADEVLDTALGLIESQTPAATGAPVPGTWRLTADSS